MSNPEPKKSLGQHWLHDEASLKAIIDAAEINDTDTVLEVGPGLGTLTRPLTDKAKAVVAVEFDDELARSLPGRVNADNLSTRNEDILDFDYSKLPEGFKVVANIPYYLTSHLVRKLSEADNPPSICVLLVQKEVAERLAAPAGSMSTLSVSAQFFTDVSLGAHVPAELFTPPPKVDSQVVILKRKETLPNVEQKLFFRVVKAGFGERRKKLANSLSGGLGVEKAVVSELLTSKLKYSENIRAQELTVPQWVELTIALNDIL